MTTLDVQRFGDWNRQVAKLTAVSSDQDAPEALMDALAVLIPSEERAILVFSEETAPIPVYEWVTDDWPAEDFPNYLDWAYLLDPYYRAGIEKVPAGLYRLGDISPGGFFDSEYFKSYWADSPMETEIGFVIYLDETYFAHLSFARKDRLAKFSDAEFAVLKQAQPIIETTLSSYWRATAAQRAVGGSELHTQLEVALSVFGTSILTPREAEIMRLYLYGHNTKSIAEKLHISSQTVSVHRKNAYARLDIGSQAELFSLFINSIYCFSGDSQIDPLALYTRSSS